MSLQAVNHGFSTILSCQYVDKIISSLDKSIRDLIKVDTSFRPEDSAEILKQHQSAVTSFENLICEWSNYAPSYPDIIEPLLSNVSEFLYGLKSNLGLLEKVLLARRHKKFDVQQELATLLQMPSLDPRHRRYETAAEACSSAKLHKFVDNLLEDEEFPNVKKQEVLRLLKCGIQESFNNCVIDGKLLNFAHFENFLKAFANSWNEQERNRQLEREEADALYKIKTKCNDKSEAEQVEDELKELFPNYHDQDFGDMRKASNLSDDPPPRSDDNQFPGVISNDDIKFVVDLHLLLVQSFTRSEWLNPEKNKNAVPNFVLPLVEKYKVFRRVCDKVINCLDFRMDKQLLESVSVLLSFVQNYGDTNNLIEYSSPTRIVNTKRADFYKDSNVEEAKSSFHIIEELRSRVMELRDEWPDHPTLTTIITVIDRIYNFDMTSPISRFLTGFEILLSKCSEWEEVAHSGVSLCQFSQNITQQIITWRKMELGMWKDLLNSTFNRLNDPTYKWWLFLYNIMEQFTMEEKFSDAELIETLQSFISKSNLAEFQNRLNLLHAFHCHAVHLKRTEKSQAFINILWNLYNYFQQFCVSVAGKIKDLRAPIEKKLKDYVKIVRWKDVNYWAIKETVDKSHKTLHKFVREFQDVLRQPVAPLLVNTTTTEVENVGIWDRPQRHVPKTYHYTLDPATYVAKDLYKKKLSPRSLRRHQNLVDKVEAYFGEARKLCKDSISTMKYAKMIQSLDNFVTQIIDTGAHLQGLEVDTTLPKEKQKSHAKSILNQKHRALADLFKSLSRIGLSFRSGLVEAQLKPAADDFLLKPVDISANFSHINYNRKDEKILTIWDSCEMYYLKSLMRADVLDTALKSPAPDLGLQNITRCRGFSSNLLTLAQKQKSQLTESSNLFYYLRHYTTQMTKVCEGKQFLRIETVETIQTLMKNVAIVMNQSKLFLNTCPEEDLMDSDTVEIVTLKPEPSGFIQYKNDPLWNKTSNLFNEIVGLAAKITADLEKCKGEIPSVVFEVVRLEFIPVPDLKALENRLDDITRNIAEVVAILGKIKLCQSLAWLNSEIDGLKIGLEEHSDLEFDKSSAKKLETLVDDLSEKISAVIKKLHGKYSEQSDQVSEDTEVQIEENHLKLLIVENLENDFNELCIADILNFCEQIAKIFFTVPRNCLEEYRPLVSYVLPLLEQIILVHQYFLTQQVSAYRLTCKMNSIILNIFIDLASKGFCVPPEFAEEMDEGESKPSDGLGLGEGRGERDVSDKIESEDQLDDAQPAGQEKKQDGDTDCKEEDKGIEMSEDFDGKMQDVEQKESDDEDEQDSNSDAEEQMGETQENADKQDKETYGSDKDDDNEDKTEEQKEERGEGGDKEGEQELGAKEKDQSKKSDAPDKDSTAEREENKKEINEMEEPEYDDEQTDPYHGNQPELPEPEPMDLPDDLQLDEGQEQDNDNEEGDNPFDIDTMKEENPFENKEKEDNEEQTKESKNDYSSEDDDIVNKPDDGDGGENEEDQKKERNEPAESVQDDEDIEDKSREEEDSGLDQTQTNEENVEAMEVDNVKATDRTQPTQAQNQKSNQPIEELCQEDKPDKEGVGQSQMEESSTGHAAQTSAPQEMQSAKRQRDEEIKKKQKPGDSDSQRSLGDINEPVKKKLKTMDSTHDDADEEGEENDDEKDAEAEMYKHIKEAKENATQVLDVATKEQAESQKNEVPNFDEEEPTESSETLPPEEEDEKIEETDSGVQKPEQTDSKKSKNDRNRQHPEGDVLEEIQEVDVEGDIVETIGATRGSDTTSHTLFGDLKKISAARLTHEEMHSLRSEVEQQLSCWSEAPSDAEAERAWQKISSVTSSLAQDLSEQLRLVLEPTLASRLKGDFRTGRRINMRKVIPYIASQFRKDKIWLRRSKPSKREYQIVLAIDDSSSMADNHSKELAFESVALISKALTLLESGQLSVVSFGEAVEIVHKLSDQFSDGSGIKLLQKFKFGQNKTCVAKLVDFVTEMFAQSAASNAKLLVIVSDGRGVFSEGEGVVRQAVRRAKLANIFMVFVIVDNPENKNSILDIRMPTFKEGKLLGIQSYMDVFPFSFYIILRDINSLPTVLSDALRQWFELVSNLDK